MERIFVLLQVFFINAEEDEKKPHPRQKTHMRGCRNYVELIFVLFDSFVIMPNHIATFHRICHPMVLRWGFVIPVHAIGSQTLILKNSE